MPERDAVGQRRRCRCCNRIYAYAVRGSAATRLLCERCVAIPEPARRVLIDFNKRLRRLEAGGAGRGSAAGPGEDQ